MESSWQQSHDESGQKAQRNPRRLSQEDAELKERNKNKRHRLPDTFDHVENTIGKAFWTYGWVFEN